MIDLHRRGGVGSYKGNITKAAKGTSISQPERYKTRAQDPAFAAALELGLDAIEDEAVRRAMDGVERPVYQRGQPVGTVTQPAHIGFAPMEDPWNR